MGISTIFPRRAWEKFSGGIKQYKSVQQQAELGDSRHKRRQTSTVMARIYEDERNRVRAGKRKIINVHADGATASDPAINPRRHVPRSRCREAA